MTWRTIGAAVCRAPRPPSSTTATTTYCGALAGKKAANTEVSPFPSPVPTCAVPVLPDDRNGVEREALERDAYAVPFGSAVTPANPAIIAARTFAGIVICRIACGVKASETTSASRVAHRRFDVRLPQRAAVGERGVRVRELQRRDATSP